MYYEHFGLHEPPFRITPNTEVFFSGGNRGAILEALIYALSQGEGIVKVSGEVGSGKTMLCNMLQSRLPGNVDTVYLAHPSVSPEEILHAIAFELQLMVARDAGRMEVMQALYNYLLERHAQGKQVVIFVEESQNMPLATLEEVRLLSNLETSRHKLLQIVLFGQPELDENLRQPQIRQLRERITHSFVLQPLLPDEVGAYLMFRMRAAGYRGPDVFNPRVVKLIAQASAGLSRRINLIADKALLAAYSENTHSVKPRHVQAAIRDSEFARDMPAARTQSYGLAAAMLGVGALAGAGAFLGYQMLTRDANAPVAPVATDSVPRTANPPAVGGTPAPAAAPLPPAEVAQPSPARAANEEPSATLSPAPVIAAGPISNEGTTAGARAPMGGGGAIPIAPSVAPAQQTPAATEQPPSPSSVSTAKIDNESKAKTDPRSFDVLQVRIDATDRWLQSERPDSYTIQLLGAENAQQLKEHLSIIGKFVEINNVFVYRTTARQKPYLTVLYGSYESREAAQEALSRLPAQLKAFRPYLRTVQGVRSEIGQRSATS